MEKGNVQKGGPACISKEGEVGKEFGVHPKGVTRLDFCFGKMEGGRSGSTWGREVGSSAESWISSRQYG